MLEFREIVYEECVGGGRVRLCMFMRARSRYRGFLGFRDFGRCSEYPFAYVVVKGLVVYILSEWDRDDSFPWESVPLVDYSNVDEIKDRCRARVLDFRHGFLVVLIDWVPWCAPGCGGRADVVPVCCDNGTQEWAGGVAA